MALKLHRINVKWKRELYKNLFLISCIISGTLFIVCCPFVLITPELFLSNWMIKYEIIGNLTSVLFIVSLIKMNKYITELVVVQHVIDERKEE